MKKTEWVLYVCPQKRKARDRQDFFYAISDFIRISFIWWFKLPRYHVFRSNLPLRLHKK